LKLGPAMSGKGNDIQDAIDRLKAGIDAAAVALIERRGIRAEGSAGQVPEALRDALERLPCLPVDWGEWYRGLLNTEEQNTTCGCSDRHQLHGLVLDKHWVIVMVAPSLLLPDGSFQPTKALAYVEWVGAIRFFLEETKPTRRSGPQDPGGGTPSSAELGIPLSWHRKSHK
jgi:hypothetical protein